MIKLKDILNEGIVDISLQEEKLIDDIVSAFKSYTENSIRKKISLPKFIELCEGFWSIADDLIKKSGVSNYSISFRYDSESNSLASYDSSSGDISFNIHYFIKTKKGFSVGSMFFGDEEPEEDSSIKVIDFDYDKLKRTFRHEFIHYKQDTTSKGKSFANSIQKSLNPKYVKKYIDTYMDNPQEIAAEAYSIFNMLLGNLDPEHKSRTNPELKKTFATKMLNFLKKQYLPAFDQNKKSHKRFLVYLYKYIKSYQEKGVVEKQDILNEIIDEQNVFENIKSYWLDGNGKPYKVYSHSLMAMQLSGKETNSDESFQWMFNHKYARIVIEDDEVMYINTSLDNCPVNNLTSAQKKWITDIKYEYNPPLQVLDCNRRKIEI